MLILLQKILMFSLSIAIITIFLFIFIYMNIFKNQFKKLLHYIIKLNINIS